MGVGDDEDAEDEPSEEAERPTIKKGPSTPSRREVEEHNATHTCPTGLGVRIASAEKDALTTTRRGETRRRMRCR